MRRRGPRSASAAGACPRRRAQWRGLRCRDEDVGANTLQGVAARSETANKTWFAECVMLQPYLTFPAAGMIRNGVAQRGASDQSALPEPGKKRRHRHPTAGRVEVSLRNGYGHGLLPKRGPRAEQAGAEQPGAGAEQPRAGPEKPRKLPRNISKDQHETPDFTVSLSLWLLSDTALFVVSR